MKRRLPFLIVASAVAAVVVAQNLAGYPFSSPAAVHVLRDSVQTVKGAYIMLPPEPILADVDDFGWSADGKYLSAFVRPRDAEADAALKDLSSRVDPIGPRSLAIIDAKTLKLRWVEGVNLDNRTGLMQWKAGMEVGLLHTQVSTEEGEVTSIYIVDPVTGRARLLFEGDLNSEDFSLSNFDSGRLLIITSRLIGGKREFEASIIDPKGRSLPGPPGLGKAKAEGWYFIQVSSKYGIILARDKELGVLLPSGVVQPLDAKTYTDDLRAAAAQADAQETPEHLLVDHRDASHGSEIWLVARPDMGVQPAALVCAMIERSSLSPAKTGVAYTSQHMLWLRRMVHMDGEKYALLRREAVKNDAVDTARKVAAAIQIYSADYDDELPIGNLSDVLGPYAKDPSIFGRFSFNLPSGSLSGIQNPDKTPLGYVQTDSGRAIVYADGHVEWQDRTP